MSLEDRLNYWDPLYLHLRLLISRSLCICIVSGREAIYIFGNLFIPCIRIYVVFWKSKSGFQHLCICIYFSGEAICTFNVLCISIYASRKVKSGLHL